jgi:hypothetical protein
MPRNGLTRFGGLSLLVLFAAVLVPAAACASASRSGNATSPAVASDGEVVLEGTLEVLVEDSNAGSRVLYFLVTDRRVQLHFTNRPNNLSTGAHVRVRGFADASGDIDVNAIEVLAQ